nr:hypothetical protein [uncultured Blautia sp.]
MCLQWYYYRLNVRKKYSTYIISLKMVGYCRENYGNVQKVF